MNEELKKGERKEKKGVKRRIEEGTKMKRNQTREEERSRKERIGEVRR